MKTTKTLIAALTLTLTALAACGKAPLPSISNIDAEPNSNSIPQTPEQVVQADAPPVVTPPANPADPTVLSFNSFATTVCDALKHWNPQTTIIQMDSSAGATMYYRFAASGVSLVVKATGETNSTPTATKTKSSISAVVCTIKIVDGQLVSVQ